MMKVRLEGNCGKDGEMKVFGDKTKTTFSVAVKMKYKGEEVLWVNVQTWAKLAEICQHLKKGDWVRVDGHWEDVEYKEKRYTYVVADTVRKQVKIEAPVAESGGGDDNSYVEEIPF